MCSSVSSIECPQSISHYTDPSMCGAKMNYSLPVAIANCFEELPSLRQVRGLAPGGFFDEGITELAFEVVANSGQSENCVFTITVNDNEKPAISCANLSTTLGNDGGECSAVYKYAFPEATDNCPGVVTARTAGPLFEGEPYPVGETLTTFEAADASGNVNSCSFNVIVVDREPPIISCADMQVEIQNDAGKCGATHEYDAPTCFDNCQVCTTEQTSGKVELDAKFFPVGVTTNTFVSQDPIGNTNSCSFAVHVWDTEIPAVSCEFGVNPVGKPAKDTKAGFFKLQATDNCAVEKVELVDAVGNHFGYDFPDEFLIKYDDDADEMAIVKGPGEYLFVLYFVSQIV